MKRLQQLLQGLFHRYLICEKTQAGSSVCYRWLMKDGHFRKVLYSGHVQQLRTFCFPAAIFKVLVTESKDMFTSHQVVRYDKAVAGIFKSGVIGNLNAIPPSN